MKVEQILIAVVVVLTIILSLEVFGVFDKDPIIGYTEKEVALMMKVKDLNRKLEDIKIENNIIERDNERISKNINTDSTTIYDGSREYRDSLRTVLHR